MTDTCQAEEHRKSSDLQDKRLGMNLNRKSILSLTEQSNGKDVCDVAKILQK